MSSPPDQFSTLCRKSNFIIVVTVNDLLVSRQVLELMKEVSDDMDCDNSDAEPGYHR